MTSVYIRDGGRFFRSKIWVIKQNILRFILKELNISNFQPNTFKTELTN